MFDLEKPVWEAFVQGRANGLATGEAYVAAGHRRSRGAARRLAEQAQVRRRLRQALIPRQALHQARLEETIAALVAIAQAADPRTGIGLREARAARLEALRLNERLTQRTEAETWEPPREMTEAEWEVQYGPVPPMPGG